MLYGIRDIAQWPNKQVSVPVLQRGLVWDPKQIELFWDSIMRGIPVGSFVICKNVKNQKENAHASDVEWQELEPLTIQM